MKKLVFGGFFAACVMLLASCLDGGNNERTDIEIGIVDYYKSPGKVLLRVNEGDSYDSYLYSPQMQNSGYEPGDIIYFQYHINFDSDENVAAQTNGYWTVTINQSLAATKYDNIPYLTDTATILSNEIPISELRADKYIQDYFVLTSFHGEVMTDQKRRYQLSYDANQEVITENDKRIYNLFMRAVETDKGKAPTSNQASLIAFNFESFLRNAIIAEKNEGKKEVNIRINYITSFNKDTTAIEKWNKLDFGYLIPEDN